MIIFPINELCGCKIIMTTANEYNLVIGRYSVFIKASHSSAEPLPFPTGGGKSFLLGGSDDVLESVLGLGDLADLTVTNDETDYGYDVRKKKPKLQFKTQTFFRNCANIDIFFSSAAVQ